jgi:hypothetical protein
MMRQLLVMLGKPVSVQLLYRLDDPRMHRAAPLLDEAGVGDLMGQGVLEGVLGFGKEPCLVEELRALEASETQLERALVITHDGG